MARAPFTGTGAGPELPCRGAARAARPESKQSLVLDLLSRDSGATLADLVDATGWLPHTARAALTGLRRKGHAIVRGSADGITRYTISTAATE